MKFMKRISVFIICLLIAGVSSLHPKSAYTQLTDPAQVKIFEQASEGMICQCGCHHILNSCPHVECPFAIPVRRFIEDRIREGMGAEEIVYKMEHGFGEDIRKDPRVMELAKAGRDDLVNGFVHGHGHQIVARTSPLIPALITILFSILAFLLYRRWRKKHPVLKTAPASDGAKNTLSDRLKDIDR